MSNVIAIVGMTGSGKSEAAEFLKTKGYDVLRFGSVVDDAVEEAGLPWTSENTAIYRKKLREELGMETIAVKMLPKILESLKKNKKLVLDGLYSWEEYVYLEKKIPGFVILCIFASPEVRYKRLEIRKERSFTKEEARKRDVDEVVATNKGGPIAISDYLIKNEETKENFKKELENFLDYLQNEQY